MQSLMGVFYHFHAVALAEDLPPLPEHVTDLDAFYATVDRGYTQVQNLIDKNKKSHILFIFFAECIQLLDSCLSVSGNISSFCTSVLVEQSFIP